jgi:hypothetical protein
MNSTPTPALFIAVLGLPLLFSVISFLLLLYWVKLRKEPSFLITVATALGTGATLAWRIHQYHRLNFGPHGGEVSLILSLVSTALLIILAVPLGIKLYRAWTGIRISPEEQAPGKTGVRAWLTPGNLIVSALVAACAAGAYGYQFLGVFALLVGCLLVQPLVNTAGVPAEALPAAPEPALTAEREKVLSLLENGKITAEESADLLNALGSTSQAGKPAAPVSTRQRMILIGAGLVLLGFFLPWFSVNPGRELGRMTGQMQQMVEGMPMMELGSGMASVLGNQMKTPTLNISGGDIQRGLGWLVLLLGLGVAALPHVATTMDAASRRMISFIALGIGGIVLLWLVTQNLRLINIGVVLVIAGYAVEFLGLLNPRPRTAFEPGASLTGDS